MKNFSDLLAIESHINVVIETRDGKTELRWPLLKNLELSCHGPISVLIDGMEIIEFGHVENDLWQIRHDEPFYRWQHRITGQGWLLEPLTVALC